MAYKQRWNDLSPQTRRFLVVAGAIEATIKVAALIDMAGRPASQINGSKRLWAAAVIVINGFGVAPLSYFALGRKTS